jgi:hypothetical protein
LRTVFNGGHHFELYYGIELQTFGQWG